MPSGFFLLLKNTSGQYNVGMGDYSLATNETGNFNTAIGHWSQINGTDEFNTAVGANSLQGPGVGIATGSYNTGIGFAACRSISIGQNNTSLGYNSNLGTTTYSDEYNCYRV